MKVSIVIATYNAAKYFAACLDSCIRQTWQDKEIIVIDGCSPDGTVEVIRSYAPHLAYWTSEKDNGIYDAWNKALSHVTGTWVLFRGADDLFWDETVLEKAMPGLETATSSELICYGTVVSVNDNQDMVGINGTPWATAKHRLFQKMTIPHAGAFHHIQLFQRFGCFDASYRIVGDYDFLLRAVKGGAEGKFLAGVIVTKMCGGGVSNVQVLRTKQESIAALRNNGVAGFHFAQYAELAIFTFRMLRRKSIKLILGSTQYELLRKVKLRRHSEGVRAKTPSILLEAGRPR